MSKSGDIRSFFSSQGSDQKKSAQKLADKQPQQVLSNKTESNSEKKRNHTKYRTFLAKKSDMD